MSNHVEEAKRKANESGAVDKTKGHANEVIGTVKEKVGSAIGNDKLKARGEAQHAKGEAQRVKGEVREELHKAGEKLKAGASILSEEVKDILHRK